MRLFWTGLLCAIPAFTQDAPDPTAEDRRLVREAGLSTDGPALLDFFRQRTYKEVDRKLVAKLVQRLGHEDFHVRERAYKELQGLGNGALMGLRDAEANSDAEVRQRVRELRQGIEAKADPSVQSAVARLVAKTRPAGAAPVLLNYIPFAADHNVVDELSKALGAVAVVDGTADQAVLNALKDVRPDKRAAAGEALARAGAIKYLPVARALLHDTDHAVRLRVAVSLAPLREKEILPVLVDVLGHLPPEQLWPAEDILVRLAGFQTPPVVLGTDEAGRKACQAAWKEWLDTNKDRIDLSALDAKETLLGYTLIVQQNFGGVQRGGGQVLELDADKNELWKIDVPTYPVDAQVVRQDRVLIAEFQGGRITERDFKGNILWEVVVGGSPLGVQRLPNGNTFVVTQQRLVEFDRNKKEVMSIARPQSDIYRARKLRTGEIVMITNTGNNGVLTLLDATRKEVKSFVVGPLGNLFGGIDVLPNGNVLVPLFQENRVVEFDINGKQVSSVKDVQLPTGVQRLPNGNTLVSSLNARRIAEFDPTGRVVWNYAPPNSQVLNVRKR